MRAVQCSARRYAIRIILLKPPNRVPRSTQYFLRDGQPRFTKPYFSISCDMGDQSRSSGLRAIFEFALHNYEKLSGITLANHSVTEQLQNCNSVESVTALLRSQARAFTRPEGSDGRIIKSLESAVSVLYTLSSNTAIAEAIDMVRQNALTGIPRSHTLILQPFSPAQAIFAAFAILLAVCVPSLLMYTLETPMCVRRPRTSVIAMTHWSTCLNRSKTV
jgi:hypothetical protein